MQNDYFIVERIADALSSGAKFLRKLVELLKEHEVVGVGIVPGTPTTHPEHPKGSSPMKVTLLKKGQMKAVPRKAGAGAAGAPITQFTILDNGDASFTVFGTDAAGAQIDISSVATLTATSDNTAVLTVDAPTGMTSAMHTPTTPPPQPGQTANISVAVTWNDPSTAPPGSPFKFTLPVKIEAGPVSGITIVPGTPTTH